MRFAWICIIACAGCAANFDLQGDRELLVVWKPVPVHYPWDLFTPTPPEPSVPPGATDKLTAIETAPPPEAIATLVPTAPLTANGGEARIDPETAAPAASAEQSARR